MLVVLGPLAGRLTDRVGPRPLMSLGLVVVSAAVFIQSRRHGPHQLLRLLPGFMLMGIGIGLVMSPMSTAAMNSVDRTKSGAASGVLSMSRMVGGTFGVAVMGALDNAPSAARTSTAASPIFRGARAESWPIHWARAASRVTASPRRWSPPSTRRSSRRSAPAWRSARRSRSVAAALAWILIEPPSKATEPKQLEGDQAPSEESTPELTAV